MNFNEAIEWAIYALEKETSPTLVEARQILRRYKLDWRKREQEREKEIAEAFQRGLDASAEGKVINSTST